METLKNDLREKIEKISLVDKDLLKRHKLEVRLTGEGDKAIYHLIKNNTIMCLIYGIAPDVSYVGLCQASDRTDSVFITTARKFEVAYFNDLNKTQDNENDKWFDLIEDMDKTLDKVIGGKTKVYQKK